MAKKSLLSKLRRPSRNYQKAPHSGATLADNDRCIFDNFKSLYYTGRDDVALGQTDFSPRFTAPPADMIKASKRFFVALGPTGSLMEEARLSSAVSEAAAARSSMAVAGKSVVLERMSADPYVDFKESMKEMVDARRTNGASSLDWDFMEDLLGLYLELNEKGVHESIFRAFVDLTESSVRDGTEMRKDRVRNIKEKMTSFMRKIQM